MEIQKRRKLKVASKLRKNAGNKVNIDEARALHDWLPDVAAAPIG
jgi:hypothetical protein